MLRSAHCVSLALAGKGNGLWVMAIFPDGEVKIELINKLFEKLANAAIALEPRCHERPLASAHPLGAVFSTVIF